MVASLRSTVIILISLFPGDIVSSSAAFVPYQSAAKYDTGVGHRSLTRVGSSSPNKSYGEQSRKYRRTVYTHEDWVKHRSSDRFFRNLKSIFASGVYQNLSREVFATCSVAVFVVTWNCIFGDYQDLVGVSHSGPLHDSVIPVLTLPLSPFTLLSPSLGLLLGETIALGKY